MVGGAVPADKLLARHQDSRRPPRPLSLFL